MSWGHVKERTTLGDITLAYVQCDECGRRWPDDSAHPHYQLENRGYLGPNAFDYLHFCTIECLGKHFETPAAVPAVQKEDT